MLQMSTLRKSNLLKRHILDQVFIAKECSDSVLKSGVMEVLCKLDLEKAQDHVNWNFLIKMLNRRGFSKKQRKWIYICISKVCLSILINGSPNDVFKQFSSAMTKRPFTLFIICYCNGCFEQNDGKGNNLLMISHLLFVDYSFIFPGIFPAGA